MTMADFLIKTKLIISVTLSMGIWGDTGEGWDGEEIIKKFYNLPLSWL